MFCYCHTDGHHFVLYILTVQMEKKSPVSVYKSYSEISDSLVLHVFFSVQDVLEISCGSYCHYVYIFLSFFHILTELKCGINQQCSELFF